jgi:hypothetical protein
MPRFRPPDSRLLRIVFGFLAAGLGTRLGLLLFRKHDTVSDAVGNFFVDFVVPYCYGAFGSEFTLVWLSTIVASIAFGFAVYSSGSRAATVAKRSLLIVILLSLFTLWVEPFVSISAAAGGVLMTLAKVPMKFVDIGVSILWLVVLRKAYREIDNKVARRDMPASSETPENAVPQETGDRPQPASSRPPEQGTIVLQRPWSRNQWLYGVIVLLNQKNVGKLRNGKTLNLPVPAGKHTLTIKYFYFTTSLDLLVNPGDQLVVEQSFGTWVARPILRQV